MGSYAHRMATILRRLGHRVEVFVPAAGEAGVMDYDGIRVERVRPRRNRLLELASRFGLRMTLWHLRTARALGRAFRRRDHEERFDLVQSCDYGMAGLFAGAGRRHIVRCSGPTGLYEKRGADSAFTAFFERQSLRRARAAYAPSAFIARHYQSHECTVGVVRPPLFLEAQPAQSTSRSLPARYLVYFGLLGARKGTDVLAAALNIAWRSEPALTMVWAGREIEAGELERYRTAWGARASQVMWLGFLPKPELYAVVRGAIATVIPSRVDNLPNTAIESLALGTPVIASAGASLDEIIEDGRNGMLVPIGDSDALANALVRAWRDGVPFEARTIDDMQPAAAAAAFLRFAGFAAEADEALLAAPLLPC